MRVIALRTLREFWEQHADAENSLRAWHANVRRSAWLAPSDVKQSYRSASFVADNRVIFNIQGNTFRLVVHIDHERHVVFIRFVGTYAQYDKIDVTTV